MKFKKLQTLEDFENLKEGDSVICEFKRDIQFDHPKKPYKIGTFEIYLNKKEAKEIILQCKNNIYFNYEMFIDGESTLKEINLIIN